MNQTRLRACAIAVVAGTISAGCTHLEVNQFKGEDDGAAHQGYAYMLDYSQYEVTLTRSLIECAAGKPPKIKFEASVVPSLVPDGAQVYVIDPESLISAFKTSDIAIEYKEGRLISFNATTEDKTGDVIKSVAITAGKIALLAGGIPMPVSGAGVAPVVGCTTDAIAKLAAKKADAALLELATGKLDAAKNRLTDLTTRYAAKPTAALAKQVTAQKAAVEAAQNSVDDLTKRITATTAWLTRTVTMTWPETSAEFDSDAVLPLDVTAITNWLDPVGLRIVVRDDLAKVRSTLDPGTGTRRLVNNGDGGNAARLGISLAQFNSAFPLLANPGFDPNSCTAAPKSAPCVQYDAMKVAMVPDARLDAEILAKQYNRVSFHLAPRGSYGKPAPSTPSKGGARAGLRYRVPAASWLYVCEENVSCARPEDKDRLVARIAGTTAQLGRVFNVPFSSPAFASGGLSMAFDDQGRLQKAGLKRTSSAALAAAEAAGSVVDAAVAYDKAKRAEALTELNNYVAIAKAKKDLADAEAGLIKTPKQSLEEELAILEATRKVEEARMLVGPSRTKELNNDIALAKLEVELADQRKKLEADPNAGEQAVKDQYDAEAAVLIAQKAKLEAEAAVIKAQQALDEARANGP